MDEVLVKDAEHNIDHEHSEDQEAGQGPERRGKSPGAEPGNVADRRGQLLMRETGDDRGASPSE